MSFTLFAQKPPIKFGEVPIEDLKLQVYPNDSAAVAVVLADFGQTTMEYDQVEGFYLLFDRITRIKILKKEGLEYANFTIPLYHSGTTDEKLSGLKAVTYNLENGKTVETKFKNDALIKEQYDANLNFVKVALPNVKEGSIVEITYKVRSEFLFNFQDWQFQSKIPTVWSEYRARVPEYFGYDKYMQGYVGLAVNEEKREPSSIIINSKERSGSSWTTTSSTFSSDKIEFFETRYRWAASDVPAFKPEPFITTEQDYISKINFELSFTKFPNQPIKNYMGSWSDINDQFSKSENFGIEVTGNGYLKKISEEQIAGLSTTADKVAAITRYVKQNVSWDGTYRKYTSKPLKKVMEEKKGSSAEINLLLASMLEKIEIPAFPILLSTRDHGFVREEMPISSQFNYVICAAKIDDKVILLDATEKLLPIGVLPERCINGRGFLVSKTGFEWVPLHANTRSRTVVNADLSISPDDQLTGVLQIDRDGYDALNGRKQYIKNESEYVKDIVGSKTWEVTKSEISNQTEISKPMKEKYDLVMNEQMTIAGDVVYLNPLIMHRMAENPFKLDERNYPVDFGSPFDRILLLRLKLPEGYQVEEMPSNKVIALPQGAGKFMYSVNQVGSVVNVVCNLQINKSIFDQTEYPLLKEFYSQVVAKQAEQIVLKKK